MAVFFSASSIAVTAWFLTLAGSLLNFVIDTTVISFNTSLFAVVNNAGTAVSLSTVWAVFRDLANIAILGAFTFIAISVILGKVTFNNKRLVANVLVAALLINFSLVFSRVIVQTSGLFACQFYKVIVEQGTCENRAGGGFGSIVTTLSTSTPVPEVSNDGVAGSFLRIVGIGGFAKTESSLRKLADDTNGGVSTVLIHGVFTSLFLLIAVAVFLIMAIMLILRAVILLFLMSISPFAFAAYAIPQWSGKFSQWWETLLRQAFFAPFLLTLLWMSSAFGKALTGEKGVIGQTLSDPANQSNIQAVFLYLFIMSLLGASVYLAARFAKSLSGMRVGAMLGALPVVGTSLAVGAGLRNSLGARAYGRAQKLGDLIDETRRSTNLSPSVRHERLNDFRDQQKKALKTAGRDFNFMNTKPMQGMAGLAGLKGVWGGATKVGGYTGKTENTAKEKVDEFKGSITTDKDKQHVLKEAQGSHLEDKARAEEQLAATKEGNKLIREKIIAERDIHRQNEKQQIDIEREATKQKAVITREESDPSQKENRLREQDAKISAAKERIIESRSLHQARSSELVEHNKNANDAERAIHTELKEINTRLRDTKLEALGKLLEVNKGVEVAALQKLGDDVGKKVVKDSGAKDSIKSLKDEIEALQKESSRAQRITQDAQSRATLNASQKSPPTPTIQPPSNLAL